ncbi:two-component system, NtrC family, response regulator AtoC [Desulfocicer vacuolatum DSM 3385]|uniref:Two-component system, NtrC family, response regulator AtoC n=1 Tax=Desulfocicer vacuolatum DSM 3385 TaxID=1121400 RepID=A0A1W2ERQ3_9BACT|nr:sigma-54 dependent transcriptional regulator [Desulfocicer vacuolatum]SMD12361.1 two-component system, NtrC family, response regulator AtoC [Desulfocicer vacuolatum DSM 3385]
MQDKRLLIVDDEDVLRTSLETNFKINGFNVRTAQSGEAAIELLEQFSPMVILLDLRLPSMDGISVLKEIKKTNFDVNVVIMTAYADTQTTVEAVKCGAYNFINKPFELEELEALVHNAFENIELKREVDCLRYRQKKFEKYDDIVGKSRVMQDIYSQIDRIAETKDTTVLIRGESGTGKELVAGAIHHKSRRHRHPFMEINCSSLPETLLESELFGHEKGAFTDAKGTKKGLFELADTGTLFLDEIGDLPLSIQVKLLGFLEKKQFKRLGCGRDIKVDVRIVTATNRNLEQAISQGLFREDLYYRLNVVTLFVPPLRERQSDIPLLAGYFLEQFCREMGKKKMTFSRDALALLTGHSWRGNVRELKNVVERAVIFARDLTLGPESLGAEFSQIQLRNTFSPMGFSAPLDHGEDIEMVLAQKEMDLITAALEKTDNNKTKASEILGISRFALNRRLQKLDRMRRQ